MTRFDRRWPGLCWRMAGRGGGPGATGNFRGSHHAGRFSDVDKRSLFFACNHLWKPWMAVTPETDQSRPDSEVVGHPEECGSTSLPGSQPAARVIYTIACHTRTFNESGSAQTTA